MARKNIIIAFTFVCVALALDCAASNVDISANVCSAITQAPNDGTYARTSYSVMVYTESGHRKGTYTIYLHKGKKYIDFNRTWICIQGKSRFFYNGNWYVIK